MWDVITCPFPNFSGATIEIWEWMSTTHKILSLTLMGELAYDVSIVSILEETVL